MFSGIVQQLGTIKKITTKDSLKTFVSNLIIVFNVALVIVLRLMVPVLLLQNLISKT